MAAEQDDRFLEGASARAIFEEIRDLPIYDIHTHVDLRLVLENARPSDPWTALCAGDHYVASMIETLGGMDRKTLFDPATDPFDKWKAYAGVFPRLLGNPVRDWTRMTLEGLGVRRPFNAESAQATWNELAEILNSDRFRPANWFTESGVALVGTTDNPIDSLDAIERAEAVFGKGMWVPSWRPDAFLHLNAPPMAPRKWLDWIGVLEAIAGEELKGRFQDFLAALAARHDHFAVRGCRASDYGAAVPAGHDVAWARAEDLFDKACRGQPIDSGEALDFQAFLMSFSMDLDHEKGWVSQIHYGPARNQRRIAKDWGGLDSGCDTLDGAPGVVHALHDLLNHFDSADGRHHKIVIYSSAMGDWEKIAGLSRIFPSVYSGFAWWYFDSVSGMGDFLQRIPDIGAGFLKMGPFVTDTRNIYSLLPRTRMYRRCLASALGRLVDRRGESIVDVVDLARRLCVDHPGLFLDADDFGKSRREGGLPRNVP